MDATFAIVLVFGRELSLFCTLPSHRQAKLSTLKELSKDDSRQRDTEREVFNELDVSSSSRSDLHPIKALEETPPASLS